MIQSNSIRKILENLNTQKNDVLLLQDRIAKKKENCSDLVKSPEINSYVQKSLENLTILSQNSEKIIEFWTIIYNLMGGMRFKQFENWILTNNGNLKIDLTAIGLKILRSKPTKIHNSNPPQMSLSEDQWLDLLDLLKNDILFLESVQKMKEYRTNANDERISNEIQVDLEKYPNLTEAQKKSYKKIYQKTGLSIEEFIHSHITPSKTVACHMEKSSESAKDNSDFDNYYTYLEANERELARMKRTGEYSVRKRGKARKRGNAE